MYRTSDDRRRSTTVDTAGEIDTFFAAQKSKIICSNTFRVEKYIKNQMTCNVRERRQIDVQESSRIVEKDGGGGE